MKGGLCLCPDKFKHPKERASPIDPTLLSIMDRYYQLDYNDIALETFQPYGTKKKASGNPTRKLNILYVTFLKYPNTGGLAHYITSIKEGFEKKGHKVDILTPNYMSAYELQICIPKAAEQVRNFMLGRYGTASEKIVKNISFLNVYESFLRKQSLEQYDVFHAQDLFAVFLLGKMNKKYKKPLFFTPHGHFTKSRLKFHKMKKSSIEEAYFSEIEKQGIRASDEIIIISSSFRTPLKDFGAKEEKMTTVHTGIDFQPIPKKANANKLVISCVARLSPRKGHQFLFQALSQIPETLSNVEVWIVGDGVMKQQLKKQVKELGLQNVAFFGKRTDIPDILSCSQIYVLPTVNDNFPISVLEAMFSEQAIITSNCGGISEMIHHQKTGILCEPGNVDELYNALQLLITNKKLRKTLGENAKKYADKHFTQQMMTSKIEKIYYSFTEKSV